MTTLISLALGSFAAVLFTRTGFVFPRVGIFSFIRLDIFDYRVHEFTHVFDSSLEPDEFVHQRLKLTIPFQDDYDSLGCDSVRGVNCI